MLFQLAIGPGLMHQLNAVAKKQNTTIEGLLKGRAGNAIVAHAATSGEPQPTDLPQLLKEEFTLTPLWPAKKEAA